MSYKTCFVLLLIYSQIIIGGEVSSLNLKKIERIEKRVTEERKPSNIIIHNYYEFGQCIFNPLENKDGKHEGENCDPTSYVQIDKMKGSLDKKTQEVEAPEKNNEDVEKNFNPKVLPLNVFVDGKKLDSEGAQNEKYERKQDRSEKITVNHFNFIIDDVENNIDEMRVYVPDGISGPLRKYFERLEPHQARHAYQNGVVRLSNGILIPLKTVVTVVDFRNWLKRQKENFSESIPRKDSYTKPMYSFNDFIMYLVDFKFVNVILPNSHLVPLVDCQSYLDHFPTEAKKRVILDIIGYEMPLFHFEQCLKLQC